MIAAGRVRMDEFTRVRTETEVSTYGRNGRREQKTKVEYSTKEERNDRCLLEIILNGGTVRYSLNADQSAHLLFQYLAERRTKELAADFKLLVQDLLQYAPQAGINRGAYYFRENAEQPFSYPSKNAFYEEITWLMWKRQQADGKA